ncbi:hypothetical protein BC629DRAFT_1550788 [Irpex lacteus]|nr:hypothetical protein BC629DRAFT_1550788 [Irpex lacteus]
MRICVLLSDMGVLLITWTKTFGSIRQLRKMHIASVTECLVRDGTLYFIAMLGLNICALVVQDLTLILSVVHTISAVLISRFLLDLRGIQNATRLDSMLDNSEFATEDIDSEMTLT